MFDIGLSAGTIEYEDTGGTGPVLVFIHGLLMDGTGWRHVVEQLRGTYRCIVPTWPLGSHRIPMRPEADLTLVGMGHLIGEFLDALDLRDVTLIQNDWGGAQAFLSVSNPERVSRLVLAACEAFDNYPPGPVKPLLPLVRIPGGVRVLMAVLGTKLGRRGPGTWGWMSKRPVPGPVMDAWFRPATVDRNIRRDLAKYAPSAPPKQQLLEIAAKAAQFSGPVLVVWATEDRMMPRDHGRRLAEAFPDARLVEIDDSYTLLAEDQPEKLTAAIEEFLTTTAG
ncbi:alpha/beta fold hydrolase [Rhodococcus rhodochrous]|uniref:alpha/beta fold hydrolase n=1 Tax=Rhodococcus rhodochrous TaxID=1829 RepID=UPI0011A5D99A|nr:alpha/beta hydrolase [Rhodococcus rhodochrous]TWH37381.1 pimeloyl-ACP methyl ester carboxylesterase [Rhodococcus rhodochrous J38]